VTDLLDALDDAEHWSLLVADSDLPFCAILNDSPAD
jgi:hypothetical protein